MVRLITYNKLLNFPSFTIVYVGRVDPYQFITVGDPISTGDKSNL